MLLQNLYITNEKQCLTPVSTDNLPSVDNPTHFLNNDLDLSHSMIFQKSQSHYKKNRGSGDEDILILFRMGLGGGWGVAKRPPPTRFSSVTSTKIGISPQNFLTFRFKPFATLM